ncbi:helix-turn-helix domain-containing protein [Coxiella burnetii]|uniref:helix-turn-helix domain-containing protein n=2 Tax=Coxiella burnetii TaxID=777 RepID=UPI0000ECFF42|nr:helix-turn-helix domain-containing protein [Coxiella burnetii]AIT63024.1 DNA-binding helix-turn-helix protein [Coxiella burnetii str. Namibia]AML49182.1 hypothetical protein AUR58_08320 [Coxiella burnetii]AML55117.1 hypothetical protein AYM38_07475 [Coxiella burnetii]APQ67024.1 hypothetical protein A35_03715 [Coxiella burnetii 'MSU Goat Q177']ARI65715.1 helix-turn-helix domain-containing protein [Coxiella burnetii]
MPWKENSVMSTKQEFIEKAIQGDTNFKNLCKTFGISRKTGYKILNCYQEYGKERVHHAMYKNGQ